MPLTSGTRLGPYEVVALIGVGGMGEVYRATDTKLNREAAIKVLPDAFATDPERVARFRREAQVLASLSHPNIAGIYGLEESAPSTGSGQAGVLALALEFVDGEDLAARLKRGAVPVDEALAIAKQIAEALEGAHDVGIIHRDLKPANIKVRPDGTVKVLDFGLAKALDQGSGIRDRGSEIVANSPTITTPAMTQAGVILGTAAYMSPEQAAGKAADQRSDLWALGVVVMEMLTGRAVFAGETVSHVLADVLKTEPDWARLPSETPPVIRRLLRRCLQKDRRGRLDSAAAARLDIEEALHGSTDSAPSPLPSRTRRETAAWTLAGLAIVTAIGVAVWSWRSLPPPDGTATSQFEIPAPETTSVIGVPAISPDGRTIAFVASAADGRSRLWLRALAELTARPLTGTDDAAAPFWSPDSRFVGFFSRGQLKKVDVTGGSPLVVTRAGDGGRVSGTWSRDGVIVFDSGARLFRVAAAGGDAESLSTLPEGARHPVFLPDGRHFLFFVRPDSGSTPGVYVTGLESSTATLVAGDASTSAVYAPPGYLLFSRGSTPMAQPFDAISLRTSGEAAPLGLEDRSMFSMFWGRSLLSVSDNGTLLGGGTGSIQTELVWVDRRGTRVATAAEPGEYGNVALSPDGTRIAFDRGTEGGIDVWLLDLPRGVTSRFTFQPGTDNVPLWSPDGRMLAFATAAQSGLDIGQRVSNASRPAELLLQLNAPPIMFPSDWSADGRFLAYYRSDQKTGLDLWVLPLFGDRKPRALLQSKFNESQGQFSPDGRWLAYVSDESGEPQVYVQSFPTLEGKWQVSRDGGSQPRWRSDGKELFYLAPDQKLMATTVKSGDVLELEAPHALFAAALTYTSRRQQYSVSKDGQQFLLNTPPARAVAPPMTVVLNWTGLLKR